MKRTMMAVLAAAMVGVIGSVKAIEIDDASSGPVKLGEWNTNFEACKSYAENNKKPLLVFWSNPGCAKCNKLKNGCNGAVFKSWRKVQDVVFCISEGGATAKAFAKNSSGHFPYLRFYWPAYGVDVKFSGRSGEIGASGSSVEAQLMNRVEALIKQGDPNASNNNGKPNVSDVWNRARKIDGVIGSAGAYIGTLTVKAAKVNKKGISKVNVKVYNLNGKTTTFRTLSLQVDSTTTYRVDGATASVYLKIKNNVLEGTYTKDGVQYPITTGVAIGGEINDTLAFTFSGMPSTLSGMSTLTQFFTPVKFTSSGSSWKFPSKGKVAYDRANSKFVAVKPDNTIGLKLSYKKNNGQFKGSCKVYAKRSGTQVRAFTAKVTGYWIGGSGFGLVTMGAAGSCNCVVKSAK